MKISDSVDRTQTAHNEHVRKVLLWRESLARLPDNHFFELIRMYLGEVKTPYNKQKLIDSLGTFLHRSENRRNLAALLSEEDMQIISAVFFMHAASQEKLSGLFAGTFTFAELYERLMNLEERLILFRYTDVHSGHVVFGINPLLDDIFDQLVSISYLLPLPGTYEKCADSGPLLSQRLLAALLSFVACDTDLCKLDGTFKKRALQHLAEVFPWVKEKNNLFFQTIIVALKNLSILRQDGKSIKPDFRRASTFAALPELFQYAYLAAAASGRCSRSELHKRAQYVLDLLFSVPAEGFTRKVLDRSEFLVKHRSSALNASSAVPVKSRFVRMLERSALPDHKPSFAEEDGTEACSAIAETDVSGITLTESAVRLGLLQYAGVISGNNTDAEKKVYVAVLPAESEGDVPLQNVIALDAGFSVTMMPGLTLSQMIPLVRCMDVTRFDTVSSFEITKQSCLRAFDDGFSTADIIAAFSPFLPYRLPQNLIVSIEDWERSYNSAALYKGYILHVTDGSKLIQNNPVVAPYIRKILAPGLFLLDFADDAEAAEIIGRSGLDSIGSVKTASTQPSPIPFTPLRQDSAGFHAAEKEQGGLRSSGDSSVFFDEMRTELDKLDLPRDQVDGLCSRIERKIILNAQQLRGDSVKSEKIEAGGMDFLGKIHVAEYAITTGSMLELIFEDAASGSRQMIVGLPVSVEKKQGDALVLIRVEPDQITQSYSLGQAAFVRRLRGAIFREI